MALFITLANSQTFHLEISVKKIYPLLNSATFHADIRNVGNKMVVRQRGLQASQNQQEMLKTFLALTGGKDIVLLNAVEDSNGIVADVVINGVRLMEIRKD